jgi:ABC-type transporter Mla maintaining outer membrane lipid asymmetry ATPase subunit MlaF
VKRKLTSIVISHDTHVVFQVAEHIAFLKDGQIRYVGPPQGVFRDPDPDVREFFSLEERHRKEEET